MILPPTLIAAAAAALLLAVAVPPLSAGAREDQAQSGERIYAAGCAACHGEALEGGAGSALRPLAAGAALAGPATTAADMAHWIRLNMPVSEPGSLTEAQSYDVTAFLLLKNGHGAGAEPLSSANASSVRLHEGAQ